MLAGAAPGAAYAGAKNSSEKIRRQGEAASNFICLEERSGFRSTTAYCRSPSASPPPAASRRLHDVGGDGSFVQPASAVATAVPHVPASWSAQRPAAALPRMTERKPGEDFDGVAQRVASSARRCALGDKLGAAAGWLRVTMSFQASLPRPPGSSNTVTSPRGRAHRHRRSLRRRGACRAAGDRARPARSRGSPRAWALVARAPHDGVHRRRCRLDGGTAADGAAQAAVEQQAASSTLPASRVAPGLSVAGRVSGSWFRPPTAGSVTPSPASTSEHDGVPPRLRRWTPLQARSASRCSQAWEQGPYERAIARWALQVTWPNIRQGQGHHVWCSCVARRALHYVLHCLPS